jgi:hypothetical protein
MVALIQLWGDKSRAETHRLKYTRGFGLVCLLATPVCLSIAGFQPWTCVVALGAFLTGASGGEDKLSEAEYYSVPGARDENYQHRCLYCSHRQVRVRRPWRSGFMKRTCCAGCDQMLY